MRIHTLILSSAMLLLAVQSQAQQTPPVHHKVLTPEQKAYQQQYQVWFARHQQLQAQAKGIFDQEAAREKAGDCPGEASNREFTVCFGKLADTAEETLKGFEAMIRELLVPPPQMPGAPAAPQPGPGGPDLTATQLIAEFDSVEGSWRQYREIACTAAFHQFGGGTGGPSFQAECELRLTRNHMGELDMIYGNVLHL